MKIALAALALVALAVGAPREALAQRVPQGSYLQSCVNPMMRDGALVATCRARGGGEMRSALAGVRRCVGDIGNIDGVLQCTLPGGAQLRGQVIAEPGYRPPPVYGAPPPPGYGAPPPVYGERCRELRHRADELRERRERAWDPIRRERIEHELHEVHMDQWRIGCPYR